MKISCKGCHFCTMSDGKQVGCSAGRLSKLIERGEATLNGDHYKLNRFCNYIRNDKWAEQFEDEDEKLEALQEESRIPVSYIIDALNGLSGIEDTLQSIQLAGNGRVIVVTKSPDSALRQTLETILGHSNYVIIGAFDDNWKSAVENKLINSYCLFLQCGTVINRHLIDSINYFINDLANQVVAIEFDDKETFLVMAIALKFFKVHDGLIDTIKSVDSSSKTVFSIGEVYDSYVPG